MKRIFFFILLFPAASFSQAEKFIVDALVKPKKHERVITVGSTTATIPGFTKQSVQIAVDVLPVEGGTVKLDAGEFKMTAPVRLRSNVTLIGSGAETILKRIDGYRSKFVIDADYVIGKTVRQPSILKNKYR